MKRPTATVAMMKNELDRCLSANGGLVDGMLDEGAGACGSCVQGYCQLLDVDGHGCSLISWLRNSLQQRTAEKSD